MSVRVATVLSARDWEPNLIAHARDSASLRIVLRAYQPEDIDKRIDEIDVVVAGAETSWVTATVISGWKRAGLSVVGMAPEGDQPAFGMLELGGCDESLPDTTDTNALIQAVRFVVPAERPESVRRSGKVVAVVGPRGAPGRSEVAVAFSYHCAAAARSTVLVDLDVEAPGIAIRLGLPPRPDILDAANAVRSDSVELPDTCHQAGSLDIITGSHRRDGSLLRPGEAEAVVREATSVWDVIVLDVGPAADLGVWSTEPDHLILVVEGSAVGLVRAAELVDQWVGPAPALVLNRVDRRRSREVTKAARRWTGLDPVVVIEDRPGVKRAAATAGPPDRRFARSVGRLAVPS